VHLDDAFGPVVHLVAQGSADDAAIVVADLHVGDQPEEMLLSPIGMLDATLHLDALPVPEAWRW